MTTKGDMYDNAELVIVGEVSVSLGDTGALIAISDEKVKLLKGEWGNGKYRAVLLLTRAVQDGYIGTVDWKGWKVDLHQVEDDEDE